MLSVQNHICVCNVVHEQHPAMTLIKQHGKVSLPLLHVSLGQIEYAYELHNVATKVSKVTDFMHCPASIHSKRGHRQIRFCDSTINAALRTQAFPS